MARAVVRRARDDPRQASLQLGFLQVNNSPAAVMSVLVASASTEGLKFLAAGLKPSPWLPWCEPELSCAVHCRAAHPSAPGVLSP